MGTKEENTVRYSKISPDETGDRGGEKWRNKELESLERRLKV